MTQLGLDALFVGLEESDPHEECPDGLTGVGVHHFPLVKQERNQLQLRIRLLLVGVLSPGSVHAGDEVSDTSQIPVSEAFDITHDVDG